MKKYLCIIMCIAILFVCSACATNPTSTEPETQSPTPLLYRVTDKEGNMVYLFGAAHIGLEEMYPLPDYVMDAYESSDVLALELANDYEFSEEREFYNAIKLEEGTTIRDYISEDTYNAAVAILKEAKKYNASLETQVPMMWAVIIENLTRTKGEASPLLGVDYKFSIMAANDNKPTESAESYHAHHAIITDSSMELQCQVLESMIQAYHDPSFGEKLDNSCRIWARGDLQENIDNLLVSTDNIDNEEYHYLLVTSRNIEMTNYAKEALATGKSAFICVGLGHVIGEGGMVDLLTKEGYTVERVN